MIKKFLAVLLAALMVMQTGVFAAFDYAEHFEDKLYEDGLDEATGKVYYVAGSNTINKKVKFAMDMGLIDVYAPNNSVTRNDIKGVLNLLFGGDAIFNKYFKKGGADSALTVDEAIVIFMDAAGYSPYISMSSNGDFAAYLSEAKRRGLLGSIKYEDAKKMFTVEMFYNMFYDALHIPVVGATYSKNNTAFSTTEETLMSSALKFHLVEGIVTANDYTALKGHSDVGENSLKIGNVTYNDVNLPNIDTFIGYNVDAFVNDEGKLVSIAVDDDENITKIFSDKVAVAGSTTLKSFEYYNDNDRLIKLKLNPYMSVIYNHVAVDRIEIKDLDVKNGSIKFIDNDNDKVYDIVFIDEYKSFYPCFVYVTDNTIDDNAGNRYDFTEMIEEGLYKGMRDEKGNAVTLADVNVNTPITLKTAYNSDVVTEMILLKERTYEGIYTQYKPKEDRPYYIGENKYQVSDIYAQESTLKQNFDSTYKGGIPHKTGERLLVYLDHNNMLIKTVQVETVYMYGYVTQISGKDKLFDSDVQVKMFTENDKWETRSFAKKVWYNQARYITPAQILNNEAPELYNNTGKIQLVKYKLNLKGQICEIETPDTSNEGFGNYNETSRFQRNYGGNGGQALMHYQRGVHSLGLKYRTNDGSTKVFVIPTDLTYTNLFRANAQDQNFFFYHDTTYTVQIFDVDKNYVPDAIVQFTAPYGTWVGGAMSQGSFVIEKGDIYNPSTDDVTPYLAFTGYNWETSRRMNPDIMNDPEIKFISRRPSYTDDEAGRAQEQEEMKGYFGGRYLKVNSFDDIRRGDVLAWIDDYFDRVTGIMLSFAFDPEMTFEEQAFEINRDDFKGTNAVTAENWTGTDIITFAKVIKKDNDAIIINAHEESDFSDVRYNRVITPGSGQGVIIYNVGDDTYDNKASFPSIQVGDFVYAEIYKNTLKNLVLYRP